MKTIILYYSYTGHCKAEAEKLLNETEGGILCEINQKHNFNKFTVFLIGCPKALLRKKSKIEKIPYNLNDFDKIIIFSPIWAGFPAPAFNAVIRQLPEDKEVELYLCSAGGETPKSNDGTIRLIADKKCKLTGYHDIKTFFNKNALNWLNLILNLTNWKIMV